MPVRLGNPCNGSKRLSEEESGRGRFREYEARHAVELEALHRQEAERRRASELAAAAGERAELRSSARRRRRTQPSRLRGPGSPPGRSRSAAGVHADRQARVPGDRPAAAAWLRPEREDPVGREASHDASGPATHVVGAAEFLDRGTITNGDVRISLNPQGRRLMRIDHARCRGTLTILALAPRPESRRTSVRLAPQLPDRKPAA